MPLAATHINYALELKDSLNIKNLNEYLAGALYPDSRCITKIDRKLTHDNSFLNKKINKLSDFEKGWYTHLLCDNSFNVFKDSLLQTNEISNDWPSYTAFKILLDIEISKQHKLGNYFNILKNYPPPFKEKISDIDQYHQTLASCYINDFNNPIIKYNETLKILKLESNLRYLIINKSKELLAKKTIIDVSHDFYNKMINDSKIKLKRN